MVDRLYVHIEGRVQGVGFRYATQREAMRRGLCGWVRNCRDGSVEAEFEGGKEDLLEMLEWCSEGPSFAAVTRLDPRWEAGPPRHDAFYVRG